MALQLHKGVFLEILHGKLVKKVLLLSLLSIIQSIFFYISGPSTKARWSNILAIITIDPGKSGFVPFQSELNAEI